MTSTHYLPIWPDPADPKSLPATNGLEDTPRHRGAAACPAAKFPLFDGTGFSFLLLPINTSPPLSGAFGASNAAAPSLPNSACFSSRHSFNCLLYSLSGCSAVKPRRDSSWIHTAPIIHLASNPSVPRQRQHRARSSRQFLIDRPESPGCPSCPPPRPFSSSCLCPPWTVPSASTYGPSSTRPGPPSLATRPMTSSSCPSRRPCRPSSRRQSSSSFTTPSSLAAGS